jgi:glutathione S-transferase
MLELYHFEPFANSLKVLLCLAEKRLAFVSHQLAGSKFEQYSPEFLAINPLGQVPVLVHDGRVLTESSVINEYLDEVFPQVPLRPIPTSARGCGSGASSSTSTSVRR